MCIRDRVSTQSTWEYRKFMSQSQPSSTPAPPTTENNQTLPTQQDSGAKPQTQTTTRERNFELFPNIDLSKPTIEINAVSLTHLTKTEKAFYLSTRVAQPAMPLSLIHISEPTRPLYISYAVFCLKKKKKTLLCQDNTH
eukprot:TRINITY_DN15082_c0_g1_i1.p1 TRINITY_DN15082_c0_g1~~TRINITY_DN15082_c0_g1_i1.p1  ORF type:complete len:139 (+),score=30.10 TRINITY_DN15082_c0_g1_i1:164-580(+)